MSEDQHTIAEDLDLESSEAASVSGGRVNVDPGDQGAYDLESRMAALQAKGYVETACDTDGTLMVNPKTNHRVTVRFT
jgi:hypothetical protein